MDFLQNLERLMRIYNINRSELARACNISASTVNSWWNRSCENISLQTLLKLAKFFNCTIEELVNGAPEKSYTFDLNEYTFSELELIRFYAGFLKANRGRTTDEIIKRGVIPPKE